METMTMPDLFDPPRISEIWMTGIRAALIHGAIALLFVTMFVTAFRNRLSHSFAHGAFLLVPSKAILAAIFAISSTTVPVNVPVPAEWFESGSENDNSPAMVSSIPDETKAVAQIAFQDEPQPLDFDDRPTVVVNSSPDIAGGDSVEQTLAQADGPELSSESRTVLRSLSPLVSCCFIWIAVVSILTIRWTLVSYRFAQSVRRTSHPSSESTIAMVIAQASQIGLRRVPRIATTSAVASPAVFGLIRPTLLIPDGFESAFDECEMRWAIAHELAHLKRRDLWAVAFERAVGLAGFFHPALWISRRATANFREQACDDFACRVTGLPPRACAETFLKILVWADRRPAFVQGSPLVLGLNPRYLAIRRRIENMTDTSNSKRHARLGVKSAVSLIALTAFAAIPISPKLIAMSPVQANQEPVDQNEKQNRTTENAGVRLTLKDAETGQPIAGAEVISFSDNIRSIDTTDSSGHVKIDSDPQRNNSLTIHVNKDGYLQWNVIYDRSSLLLPFPPEAEIEGKLVRGATIGGRVTDKDGLPIADAKVTYAYELTRDGKRDRVSSKEVRTDADGRWISSSFDSQADRVRIKARHPKYVMGLSPYVADPRSEIVEPFRELVDRTHTVRMQPGHKFEAKVIGPNGHPVEGARAYLDYWNGYLEDAGVSSNAEGLLEVANLGSLDGSPYRSIQAIVHKPGIGWYSMKLTEKSYDQPMTIRLEPPRKFTMQVVDPGGKPIVSAQVRPDYLPPEITVRGTYRTDEQGIFETDDFPPGKWPMIAMKAGFEGDSIQADAASSPEMKLILRPEPRVEGTVTDSLTGEPVKSFRIIQVHDGQDLRQREIGSSEVAGRFIQNWFYAVPGENQLDTKIRIRIEADGYEPFETEPFLVSKPPAMLGIAMKSDTRSKFITGKVLKPDGTPAADAEVSYFTVMGDSGRAVEPGINRGRIERIRKDGGLIGRRSIENLRNLTRTAPDGTFRIPVDFDRIGLVVTHESGAYRAGAVSQAPNEPVELKLLPLGQVEGQVLVAGKPMASKQLTFEYIFDEQQGRSSFSIPIQGVTDENGRFVFDRIVPGKIQVRYPRANDGGRSGFSGALLDVAPGATTRLRASVSDFGLEEVVLDVNGKETSKFLRGEKEPIFRVFGYAKDPETRQPVTPVMAILMTGLEGDDVSINSSGGGSPEGAFQAEYVWSNRPKVEVGKIDPYLVVYANGYEPYVSSQRIKHGNESSRTYVLLKKVDAAKMRTYAGSILRNDGSPALGAKITSTVVDPGIKVGDSIFRWRLNDHQAHEVDNTGKFEIVSPRELDTLFVKDDSGYVILKASDAVNPNKPESKLTPWARIEGKVKFAGKPIEKLALTLSYDGVALPSDQARANVKIDRDGNFSVPQALSRPATLSFYDTSVEGKSRLAKSVIVEAKPGESARTEVLIEGDAAAPDSKPLEKTKTDVSKSVSQLEQAPKPVPSGNAVKQSRPEFPAATGKFIVGRVLKPDGTPAIGAEVGIYTSQDDRNGRFLPRMNREGRIDAIEHKAIIRGERRDSEREPVITDADGRFRLPVWAEKFGWFVTHDSGSLRSAQLAELPEGELELKLQSFGRIEGRLLVDGEPANQMFVQIHMRNAANSPEELQGEYRRTQTDTEGRFVIDRVSEGPHHLRYPDMSDNVEEGVTIPQEIVMKAGDTIRSEVNLSKHGWEEKLFNDQGAIVSRKGHGAFATGFRVYGQVLDADTGEPVSPVFAHLASGNKGDSIQTFNPAFRKNLFEVSRLFVGDLTEDTDRIDPYIVVASPLYEPYVSPKRIRRGGEPVRHDVRLKKLPSDKLHNFEGQVLDPSGNPAKGVKIWHELPMASVSVGLSELGWKFSFPDPTIVSDSGKFQFADPKVEGKLMFASETGVAVVDRSEFSKLPGGVVRLGEWGKVRMKFTHAGQPFTNLGFSMSVEEGWRLRYNPVSSYYSQPDGSFLLDRVPPGPLALSVSVRSKPSRSIKSFTVNVKAGETTEVDAKITDEELQKVLEIEQASGS
ncbi:hypothetical protein FGO68_gene8817 [Halteria grandinella]|uniref:Peptidase M56 domain-containing protein n=1 Tax=Halteria grandinella TaxID=5974 RepID=A0A8J8NB17_HALGN|nr:hypothetical protein FGO68_gene8817 [Halteria grandinella]